MQQASGNILLFLSWTLMLYSIHRLVHRLPLLSRFHLAHHRYIKNGNSKWNYKNLVLYTDDHGSTIDMWLTEVIPTILFCVAFNALWLWIFYYIWAALLQDTLEHSNLDWYPLTTGKWHMVHHRDARRNFGLFLPIWDKVFGTEKRA